MWWKRSTLFTANREMDHLQRVAIVAICGATSTAPLRAMEALLNFPPLTEFVMASAMKCCSRLIKLGLWGNRVSLSGHSRIRDELEGCVSTHIPSDRIAPIFYFNKPFSTIIDSRESWAARATEGANPPANHWFTDGSRRDGRSGAGVFCEESEVELYFPLGEYASVFQAEVFAILKCVEHRLKSPGPITATTICSDSQAALKALSAVRIDSGLVLECRKAIQTLTNKSVVSLMWVPGHSNIRGNDKADKLAAQGSESDPVGPEPIIPAPPDLLKGPIDNWLLSKARLSWSSSRGQVQAKQLIEGFSNRTQKSLLGLKKNQLREIVGVLTGHWLNNSYMKRIGLRDDPDCDFCGESEDNSVHFLCECPFFQLIRLRCFGSNSVEPSVIKNARIERIWEFLWRSRRQLFGQRMRRMTG